VTLKNIDTAVSIDTTRTTTDTISFRSVNPGAYEGAAEKAGFKMRALQEIW